MWCSLVMESRCMQESSHVTWSVHDVTVYARVKGQKSKIHATINPPVIHDQSNVDVGADRTDVGQDDADVEAAAVSVDVEEDSCDGSEDEVVSYWRKTCGKLNRCPQPCSCLFRRKHVRGINVRKKCIEACKNCERCFILGAENPAGTRPNPPDDDSNALRKRRLLPVEKYKCLDKRTYVRRLQRELQLGHYRSETVTRLFCGCCPRCCLTCSCKCRKEVSRLVGKNRSRFLAQEPRGKRKDRGGAEEDEMSSSGDSSSDVDDPLLAHETVYPSISLLDTTTRREEMRRRRELATDRFRRNWCWGARHCCRQCGAIAGSPCRRARVLCGRSSTKETGNDRPGIPRQMIGRTEDAEDDPATRDAGGTVLSPDRASAGAAMDRAKRIAALQETVGQESQSLGGEQPHTMFSDCNKVVLTYRTLPQTANRPCPICREPVCTNVILRPGLSSGQQGMLKVLLEEYHAEEAERARDQREGHPRNSSSRERRMPLSREVQAPSMQEMGSSSLTAAIPTSHSSQAKNLPRLPSFFHFLHEHNLIAALETFVVGSGKYHVPLEDAQDDCACCEMCMMCCGVSMCVSLVGSVGGWFRP